MNKSCQLNLEWAKSPPMYAKAIETLEQALGYEFKNRDVIAEALTHRSFRHESGHSIDNERLEFLGDAVLDLCITESIMGFFPDKREGQLSKIRSQLVSEQSLAQVAQKIGLGKALMLGKGEELSGGRERHSILADTLEAVIAAIYLDAGLPVVRQIIEGLFDLRHAEKDSAARALSLLKIDSKSKLQELFQSLGYPAPTYSCVKIHGPEHSRTFVMGLFVQGVELTRAKGSTKKEATQWAATELLSKIEACEENLEKLLQDRNIKINKRKNFSKKTIKQRSSKFLASQIVKKSEDYSHDAN